MTAAIPKRALSGPVDGFSNRAWPWLAAVVSLLPFLLHSRALAELYWFGDEWDLMNQISVAGFVPWLGSMFAENFVPLFKLLWGGVVVLTGSHQVMLWLGWFTHACNVALLGLVLQRAGFRTWAALPAVLVFGLSPTNVETLVWTVQWSASLATGLLLLSLLSRLGGDGLRGREGRVWLPALFGLCSALCFSRGVLSGLVVGVSYLFPLEEGPREWRQRLRCLQACVLPSVVVAVLIALHAPGNLHGGTSVSGALYFAHLYLGQNPLHRLLSVDSTGWRTALVLLLVKLMLAGWCLARSRGRVRGVIAILLLLDLGNACLLGLGRYQTGAGASVSSRYQYMSQICFMPLLGFWLENRLWRLRCRWGALATWSGGLCLAAVCWLLVAGWSGPVEQWSRSHGTDTRRALAGEPVPGIGAGMPGVDFISPEQARALEQVYLLK